MPAKIVVAKLLERHQRQLEPVSLKSECRRQSERFHFLCSNKVRCGLAKLLAQHLWLTYFTADNSNCSAFILHHEAHSRPAFILIVTIQQRTKMVTCCIIPEVATESWIPVNNHLQNLSKHDQTNRSRPTNCSNSVQRLKRPPAALFY